MGRADELKIKAGNKTVKLNKTKIDGKCQTSNETFWMIFKHHGTPFVAYLFWQIPMVISVW